MFSENHVSHVLAMDVKSEPEQSTQLRTAQNDANWIEAESIRAIMPMQPQTQIIALFVSPLVFLLLYGDVFLPGLIAWLVFSLALTAYRWKLTAHYMQHLLSADTAAQLQFKATHGWTWQASALVWSGLVFLFFSTTPMNEQLLCWFILAGIGVFSSTSYAPHIKTMRRFINTMMTTVLLGLAWRYATNTEAAKESMIHIIVPLQLVLWKLVALIGKRLNQTHLRSLALIKGNQELIASLKDQTLRANQAVATKNRFLASAAHDIRQPVLALDLYASLLRSEPDMADELTNKIGLATKSVIDMFDSLFDLARLESGQLNIHSKAIDVQELMHELNLQYKPAAKTKNLSLRMRTKAIEIQTDHQLLKRILGNLLMNAIKFTHSGGILLACRPTLRGVRFEVWDTGVGIPADQQVAVFREFYKSPAHMGTSEGFGLGLSIVARLCEPLGFDFSMQSRVGRGTVFCIEVPTLPPATL
jgi:signal transduction histidine kinase